MVSNQKKESDKRKTQYAGLILKDATSTCGTHCYTTQIDGVLTCILREGDSPLPPATFKDTFRQETVDFQTQVGHQSIGNNLRTGARFEVVQQDLCELERKVLSQGLQGLAAGNKYSLLDLFGRGSVAHTAGAIAYITKCVEVNVGKASYPNCTNEIPVREHEASANRTRFADPLTLILRDYPTIIPCSDYMPPGYMIGNEWFCAHPATHTCKAPRKLETSVNTYTGLGDFTEGMGQGIYSTEQKEAHAAFQRAVSSRAAVIAKVTNSATHDGIIMDKLGYTLSAGDVGDLRFDIMGTYFPWVLWLGAAWPWLVGGCLIFSIIKMLLGSIIRMYLTIREHGMGCWVLAAIWSTTFNLIGAPFRFANAAVNAAGEDNFPMGPTAPDQGPPARTSSTRRPRGPYQPYRAVQHKVDMAQTEANSYAASPRVDAMIHNPLMMPLPGTSKQQARYGDTTNRPGLLPMPINPWQDRPAAQIPNAAPRRDSQALPEEQDRAADLDTVYGTSE